MVLTKKDGQGVGAANQLVEHVAVNSFNSVDELPIILVGQPLIEQFTAPQIAYTQNDVKGFTVMQGHGRNMGRYNPVSR